ncbi:amino acid adenylation domain-containing protein [Bacillus mycoides]|nr:amino acid adenylation domain-containing protein [Bacillus mycoides]
MSVIDLLEKTVAVREARIKSILIDAVNHNFNIMRGPLFRVTLIRKEIEKHVLLVNFHPLILDEWSNKVFIEEFYNLYKAYTYENSSPLAVPLFQYTDYLSWQQEWMQSKEFEEQLIYWKEKLGGELSILRLPFHQFKSNGHGSYNRTKNFELSNHLYQNLKHLSRQAETSLFVTFLAVFKVLLYRYTGQEDLLVSSPISNRNQKETERIMGYLSNILILRTNLSKDLTFSDSLRLVHKITKEAYAHKDVPFERLIEELQLGQHGTISSLFQVMFVLQDAIHTKPKEYQTLSGLCLKTQESPSNTLGVNLKIILIKGEYNFRIKVEYNTDLFDDETISRMWQHYITLLESVVNNPEQSISQLPMLTMEEKKQALLNWNNTNVEYPRERCIQDLFEEQVRQNPDAIALRYLEQSMTYSQLNQQANQLAHYLKKQGVTPQTMVGLCVERSMDMIIGILGILKVGGIYVPLDASYPEERLRFMIEDAKISVLVTQSHMKEVFPCDGMTTVMVDHDWKKISQESLENPRNELTGEHIAYVNYTSGSTGKPKGVVIPHRGVLRLVKENNYVRLTSKEILLQFAPVSFDAATFEIWGSLLNGAQLVIYPYGQASLEELGQVLRQNKVSTLWLTAGLFHQMVEYRLEDLKGVRQILAGGDVLSPVHVRKVLEELDDCLLINGYGPTENTTFTCCYPMSDVSQVRHTVPIGRPIANTQVYVLDQQLQPVPIGIPGELYIGGDGLALEYLNQPALTKEKFIPHLFSDDQEAQLYKTGDLVRYLPDGNIEFLGRTDNQVKIRGFRIELGEIETLLTKHPNVQEAVVITKKVGTASKHLVAYVVRKKEVELTVDELGKYIKLSLPEYMVPTAFVVMDKFPLNPNGKIDRKALPDTGLVVDQFKKFVAPRDDIEGKIASIWMELLGKKRIGVYDSFLELGGHSLLATQVISRLNQTFQLVLTLSEFLREPTINSIAMKIRNVKRGSHGNKRMTGITRQPRRVYIKGLSEDLDLKQ